MTYDAIIDYFDRTCADEWSDADPSSVRFQECQAMVRSCIGGTRAACVAAAAQLE